MRVPVREFKACPALEDANYPITFEYAVLNVPRSPPAPMPAKTQAQQPAQTHANTNTNVSVTQTVNVSTANIGAAIQNLDLNNINSVVQVYKILFPGGKAIDPKVVSYKSVLEGILSSKGVNIHSM